MPGLALGYVIFTIMVVLVVMIVVGVRMSDPLRWLILVGWITFCAGNVFVMERLGTAVFPDCRMPIGSEEERLVGLIQPVLDRAGSKMRIRFLVRSAPEKPTGSLGYRTILIQSGCLPLASDGELQGILAHELGHLRDGDRVFESAFAMAGLFSQLFRWGCRLVRWGFGVSVLVGLVLLGILSPALLLLLIFYFLDGVFRGLQWGLKRWIDYRQDTFAFRVGCGDGLRAWLERTGLAANAHRIRRLEKMK
jgi:Zn-dependent protease with chaperone function